MIAGWSTPIADEQAGEVLRWYVGLEEQVVDSLRVFPPHGKNLDAWSPKLATVLVEACCLMESVFYGISPDFAVVRGKPKPREKLTLGDYAELHCKDLRLPDRTAILLTDAPEYRTPFTLWTDLLRGACFEKKHVPTWWALYNRSKHRRIGVFTEFTLSMAIDALAGALMVISTVPAFTPALVRHEWLPLDGWNPEALVEAYLRALSPSPYPSGYLFQWFTVERRLFAVPIGHSPLPSDIKDFRPVLYGASPKLLRYFLKW